MVDSYMMMISCKACKSHKTPCICLVTLSNRREDVNNIHKIDKQDLNEFLNCSYACLNKRKPHYRTEWREISLNDLRDLYSQEVKMVNPLLDQLTVICSESRTKKPSSGNRFSDIEVV